MSIQQRQIAETELPAHEPVPGWQPERILESAEPIGPTSAIIEYSNGAGRMVIGSDLIRTPERMKRLSGFLSRLPMLAGVSGHARLALDPALPDGEECLAVVALNGRQRPVPDWTELEGSVAIAADQPVADWDDRRDVIYWRGRLAAHAPGLRALMEGDSVGVCVLSRFRPWLDARFTGIGDYGDWDNCLRQSLTGLEVLDERDSGDDWSQVRYALACSDDPDEPASLRARLTSGACVMRLGRAARTWFDDRLTAEGVIVEVDKPGDLEHAYNGLRASGDGRRIAELGGRFVSSLTTAEANECFRRNLHAALVSD